MPILLFVYAISALSSGVFIGHTVNKAIERKARLARLEHEENW